MHGHRKSLIELNVAVLLWAGTALFAKWIALPAFQITGLRSVVGTLALLIVLWKQGQCLRVAGFRDLWVLVVGGVALGVHWVTYFASIQASTVAIGILALHIYPVMTALVEPVFFRERLHLVDVLLGLMVLIGVAVLVPDYSLASPIARGVLLGVLSAVCFTARNILTRRAVRVYSGAQVTFYQLLAAAGALLPFTVVAGEPLSFRAGWQVLLLGALFTALPHTLYTKSLQHLKAKSAGIIATLLPVYGSITAALLLGEIPAPRTVFGGLIILAAVALETGRLLKRPEAQAASASSGNPAP
jgi:drug/metabolite transporter (DMT)-like permease